MAQICILLTIVLAVFKAAGVLAITWVWVLAPLWIPFAVMLAATAFWFGVLLIAAVVALIADAIAGPGGRSR